MTPIPVRVPAEFWVLSALPEGYIERWVSADASSVDAGSVLALVRVEGQLHKLLSPAKGRLHIDIRTNGIVDPGIQVAHIQPRMDA